MNSTVVITGMGIVSPLGCGVNNVWQRLTAGQSGIKTIDDRAFDDLPVRIAGLVPSKADDPNAGYAASDFIETKEIKKLDTFTCYAIAAADEAIKQAGWFPATDEEQRSTATIIGTGIGGFTTVTAAQNTLTEKGHRRISPFTVPAFLANLAAGNVAIRYGFKGPMGCPVTACAAGVQAIGDGVRLIKSGEAKIALVGGAEACVDPLSFASFNAMKALSTNTDAQGASRPFDKQRDGFVMGQGAGMLVIESLEHALQRGATPLAVISGYGTSCDAYHISSGSPDGSGAAAAIKSALTQSALSTTDIDHINAHATSTPVGDNAEIASLRSVFGGSLAKIPISATKSATGHLLGAAGGVETIFAAMAIRTSSLPPTLNLHEVDEGMVDLDLVPLVAKHHKVKHALCNGFGFGGVNACIILSQYQG